MGWELRGRGLYYYRARKVAGRVVRQYFGRGEVAGLTAAEDAAKRTNLEQSARAWRAERARFACIDSAIDRLMRAVQAVIRAQLLLQGYKRHERGNWRRHRGG